MLRRVLPILIILAALLGAIHIAPRATYAQTDLKVESQTATPNYPSTVDFTLKTSGFTAQDAYLSVYDPSGSLLVQTERLEVLSAPTASVSLSYTLVIQENYLPPDTDLTYTWTLEGPNGASVDAPSQHLTMTDARFQWKSATDAKNNVTVHWHAGLDDFGSEVIDIVDRSIARIQPIMGAKPKGRISIWLYEKQTELFALFPGDIVEWSGGFALPSWGLIMANIPEGGSRTADIRFTIPHEVSHLAFDAASKGQQFGDKAPQWLDEGLATHFQESGSGFWDANIVAEAAHDGKLIPLADLDDAFNQPNETLQADLAYAESLSIVEFILNDKQYGPDKITKTLNAFRNDATVKEAFQKGTGSTVEEIDSRWRTSIGATNSSANPTPAKPHITTDGGFLGLIPAMFCLGMPVLIFLVWLPSFLRKRRLRNLES